jgi:hypothetical protein
VKHYEEEAARQRAELEKWKAYSKTLLAIATEKNRPLEEVSSDVGSAIEKFSVSSFQSEAVEPLEIGDFLDRDEDAN